MRIMIAVGLSVSMLMGLLVMIPGDLNSNTDSARIAGRATALSDTIKPTANAGIDQNVSVGAKVRFNASLSVDAGGSIANYTWSFVYDGKDAELYGATPSFTFEKAGDYGVTLIVTDEAGLNDTDLVIIRVAAEKAGTTSSLIYSGGAAVAVSAMLVVLFIALRKSRGDGEKEEPSDGSEEEFEEA
jgi:PKD repeat protein